MASLGPLVPADELLVHQIADTFATVSQSDRSWTEKVWAMATDRQGSIQAAFGFGVYPNRGVIDAFGGVSKGVEQWTVRASGRLGRDPGRGSVGPFHYEVLEPLKKIRFALDSNEVAPVSFEWIIEGAVPPALEQREQHREAGGRRISADVVRYHQVGSASGWIDVHGSRTDMNESSWVSARDHSWGVRYGVGSPVEDAAPEFDRSGVSSLILWCPVLFETADHKRYAMHWYLQEHSMGSWNRQELQGGIEQPNGSKQRFAGVSHQLTFRPDNRRFVQGSMEFKMEDGSTRPIRLRAVSDTGFQLGAGLYMGYDGKFHGQWRDEDFLEGEYHQDCSTVAEAIRLHQLRDCVIEVEDPVGGGTGWGNLQSFVTGAHPAMGLDAEGSFV
ncbi:MAG: hypothetical protein WAM97_02085 [Acidimicrobiales bacterium]|jgi:hypothetical protein